MQNPETAIVWGEGWKKYHQRTLLEPLKAAVDLAATGLRGLGIAYNEPKVMTVDHSAYSYDGSSHGGAYDMHNFSIYVPSRELRRNELVTNRPGTARTILHELVHCIRMEIIDDDTLAETAATEGLAECATDKFVKQMLPNYVWYENRQKLVDRFDISGVEAEFMAAVTDGQDFTDEICDEWFVQKLEGQDLLTAGTLVGVHKVSQLLRNGAQLPDLIYTSAETLLGITSHAQAAA